MAIHPTAIIDKKVEIGNSNEIGPYVVIEGEVKIGNNNKIGPGTVIIGNTTIGDDNIIHGHVYIGNEPQDLSYRGDETGVVIGNHNTFREYSNVHRGTKEGSDTVIGNDNYFMVSVHIAHNCRVGNRVIMVNNATLGGYCEVNDFAFISGYVLVHQFVRIGGYCIISIGTVVTQDIPPYMMVSGSPAAVRGLNVVGLKRNGFDTVRRAMIKKAFRLIYRSGYSLSHSVDEIKKIISGDDISRESVEDLKRLILFMDGSRRGVLLRSTQGHNEGE